MVEVTAERGAAEEVVIAGEEDEAVPGVIDHARGHGHRAQPGAGADLQVLAQAVEYAVELPRRQLRPLLGQRVTQAGREIQIAHRAQAGATAEGLPQEEAADPGYREEEEGWSGHAPSLTVSDGVAKRW